MLKHFPLHVGVYLVRDVWNVAMAELATLVGKYQGKGGWVPDTASFL